MNEKERQDRLIETILEVAGAYGPHDTGWYLDPEAMANLILVAMLADYTPKQVFFPNSKEELDMLRHYAQAVYYLGDWDIHSALATPYAASPRPLSEASFLKPVLVAPDDTYRILLVTSLLANVCNFAKDVFHCLNRLTLGANRDIAFPYKGVNRTFWLSSFVGCDQDETYTDLRFTAINADLSGKDPVILRFNKCRRTDVVFFPALDSLLGLAALAACELAGIDCRALKLSGESDTVDISYPVRTLSLDNWSVITTRTSPVFRLRALNSRDLTGYATGAPGTWPLYVVHGNTPVGKGHSQHFNLWDCI